MAEPARVQIVQLSPAVLTALADGDLLLANALTQLSLADWFICEEVRWIWCHRARQAAAIPEDVPWITGIALCQQQQQSVGLAGFHGAPDERGMVEVGYAIHPAQRRRGYARAAVNALIERARRESEVRVVRARVAAHNVASTQLIVQFGFTRVGEQRDEREGVETVYELPV